MKYEMEMLEKLMFYDTEGIISSFPLFIFIMKEDINTDTLQCAVVTAIKCHPIYGCKIMEDPKGPYLETNPEPPIIVDLNPDTELFYGNQTNNHYPWLIGLRGKEILFTQFHGLADAMGAMNLYADARGITPVGMVGFVAKDMLGKVGGLIAIIGVIVLPISTGDTALRSLRLIVGDFLHFDQSKKKNRLVLSLVLSALVVVILLFSKLNATGFNVLWRYFSWSNQAISIFAFAIITVYLFRAKKPFVIALIPGAFYAFIIATYIVNAKIGFGLPLTASYVIGILFAAVYCGLVLLTARKKQTN